MIVSVAEQCCSARNRGKGSIILGDCLCYGRENFTAKPGDEIQGTFYPQADSLALREGRVRRATISLAISTGISIDTPASIVIPQSGRLIG